ncbi:hypothetical protein SPI_00295 [Niveomyces insectorum RCEF 264]|uniref:Uncharacterized protein n=1 Tax=Niveomyces insectorum RCEF 264 TaxID=1081102 RepID=A0A168A0G7_9HYPO|nr:hypothetical protein SPI_00295 [Niveomyces insectorum RCEF 264]
MSLCETLSTSSLPWDSSPPDFMGHYRMQMSLNKAVAVRPAFPRLRQQCNEDALQRLIGAVQPRSRGMVFPEKLLPGPLELFRSSWKRSYNLSELADTNIEYRERMLTPDERLVARPCEIRLARKHNMLGPLRAVWAARLTTERMKQESMARRLNEAQEVHTARRRAEDEANPGYTLNKPSCAVSRHIVPPPVVSHANKLDGLLERTNFCGCASYRIQCGFCTEESVRRNVDENQI